MVQLSMVIRYEQAFPDYQTIEINNIQVGTWNPFDGLQLEEHFKPLLKPYQIRYIEKRCNDTANQ